MKYSDTHEWINCIKNLGKVGITKHAKNELGDIVYVQLPKVGQRIEAGEEVAVLESTKAAADIYCPVSGKVVKINEELLSNLAALNADPETSGWLFEIELSHPDQLDELLEISSYEQMFLE